MDSKQIIKGYEYLKGERVNFENLWEEVSDRVSPNYIGFTGERTKGERKGEKIFDTTAPLAAKTLVGIIMTLIIPANQRFSSLRANDMDLMKDKKIREYYERLNKQIFNNRFNPASFCRYNLSKTIYSLVLFGNGIVLVEDKKKGMRYRNIPLQECYFDENADGVVDVMFRAYKNKLRQIKTEFGKLPEDLQEKYDANPYCEDEYMVIHYVAPNSDYNPNDKDKNTKPFVSKYILKDKDGFVLSESGYDSFPYIVVRDDVLPGEKYGRSILMTMLPEIQTLNEMDRSVLHATNMANNPPLLLSDELALSQFSYKPNALIFGGIKNDGTRMIEPLMTAANIPLTEEMLEKRRNNIRNGLFINLFNILQENPRMTATEVVERLKEKYELLSPIANIIEEQLLTPMTMREIDILIRAGYAPKPPSELEKDGEYDIVYDSPMSKMAKSSEVSAIMNTFNILSPIANLNQDVFSGINLAKVGELTAIYTGVPEEIMYSDDEKKKIEESKAKQAEMMQMQQEAEVAKTGASALKDISGAAAQ